MATPNKSYTVIREYQCLYDAEELVRRIIRHHMKDACEKKELWEHGKSDATGQGKYDR